MFVSQTDKKGDRKKNKTYFKHVSRQRYQDITLVRKMVQKISQKIEI